MPFNRSRKSNALCLSIKVAEARKVEWPKLKVGDRLTVIGIGGYNGRDTDYLVLPDRAIANLPFFGTTDSLGK